MDEAKKIKIEQWILENINVELKQQPWDSLNINANLSYTDPIYTKNTWVSYVSIIDKKDFNIKASSELNIISKSVTTLWLAWILFWEFDIKISQFIWLKIEWNSETLKWVLWTILIIEIILLFTYFYRDSKKLKIDKVDNDIWFFKNLKKVKEQIKKEKNQSRKKNLEKELENIKNENDKISIQLFQKNIIFYLLKFILPLFIWYLWIKSIWLSKIIETISFINLNDIIILISWIVILYLIFLKKLR